MRENTTILARRSQLVKRGAWGFAAGFALYGLLLWLALALEHAVYPGGYGQQGLIIGAVTFLLRALAGGIGGWVLGSAAGALRRAPFALAGAAGYAVGGLLSAWLLGPLSAGFSSPTGLISLLIFLLGPALTGTVSGAFFALEAGEGPFGRWILAGVIAFILGAIAWSFANQAVKVIGVTLRYPGSSEIWFVLNNVIAYAAQGLAIGAWLGYTLGGIPQPNPALEGRSGE
jgi:hypothetical protein